MPKQGNSGTDLAFARSLVKRLLDEGDITGAVNLAVASRGLVEQAFDEAIQTGVLLGPAAVNRLAGELVDILADSVSHIHAIDEDAYFQILDRVVEKVKALPI